MFANTSFSTGTVPGSATNAGSAPTTGSTIDIIWCDFGGVLTPHLDEAITNIVQASGVPWATLMTAAARVAADLGVTGLGPLELGLLSQAEWGNRVERALPIDTPSQVSLGRWDEFWYRNRPLNTELLAELVRLHEGGTRIGMLTNSVAEWEPHRARMLAGVSVFDCYVRSHEIQLAKPDPRIFEHSDEQLPPAQGRVILIDDLAANCEAAISHGWSSIHHTSTASTVTQLRALQH